MVYAEPDPTDAKLVARSLDGDRAAFGLLVERHRPSVGRLLRAMFANLVGVEDLVQESFLQAYLDLERLRDPGRFDAWVRSIAVNLARMEIRSGRLAVSLDAVRPGSGPPRPSPERLAEQRELARRIRQAIAALPPAEREAISHVYLNELSHREAAEELNTSVGAIKVRVHRGRRRLRKTLVHELPGRARQMEAEMIEVTVYDVLVQVPEEETLPQVDESRPAVEQAEDWLVRLSTGGHRVILLAERDGERILPIWVGPTEAEGILIQLQERSPARPSTFDLVKSLLAVGKMQLRRVAINRLHEQVFYGVLVVQGNGSKDEELDCRPSDAINLAVRTDAPILVTLDIMDQVAVIPQEAGSYNYLTHKDNERWVSLLKS